MPATCIYLNFYKYKYRNENVFLHRIQLINHRNTRSLKVNFSLATCIRNLISWSILILFRQSRRAASLGNRTFCDLSQKLSNMVYYEG